MYLMCGQLLAKAGRAAGEALGPGSRRLGVADARAHGNQHPLGEIQEALAGLR